MPTEITIPNRAEIASSLTTLGILCYGTGVGKLRTAFQEFQEIVMTTMVGTASQTKPRAPRAQATSEETPARRRGRPPTANKAAIAAKGKSGVSTADIVAYITNNPGVTQTALREVFSTVAVNVLGRMLATAMKPTKTRPAQIALSGDGYWPRLTARQAA